MGLLNEPVDGIISVDFIPIACGWPASMEHGAGFEVQRIVPRQGLYGLVSKLSVDVGPAAEADGFQARIICVALSIKMHAIV